MQDGSHAAAEFDAEPDETPAPRRATCDATAPEPSREYLDVLHFVDRLHRLTLDLIKDGFERRGFDEINSVQALLLFNIGDQELSSGDLRARGFYQGSNASYNVKKLAELGFLQQTRCANDRRSVRIRLTDRGRNVRDFVAELHAELERELRAEMATVADALPRLADRLRALESFWRGRIRFIY